MTSKSLQIKTFGDTTDYESSCDVVRLSLKAKDHRILNITALVVPTICHSLTSQSINHFQECYDHLQGLELVNTAEASDRLEVDVVIGSDLYWSLVTGQVIRGREAGPIPIQTKIGWVLSGPATPLQTAVNLTLTSTYTLKIDTFALEPNLEYHPKRFWELESLEISWDEASIYEKFVQQIRFDGQRYEVCCSHGLQYLEVLRGADILCQDQIEWKFNLERAPWWGRIFEWMVKSRNTA